MQGTQHMTLYIHQKNLLVNIRAEIFIAGKPHLRMTLPAHLYTPSLGAPAHPSSPENLQKCLFTFPEKLCKIWSCINPIRRNHYERKENRCADFRRRRAWHEPLCPCGRPYCAVSRIGMLRYPPGLEWPDHRRYRSSG